MKNMRELARAMRANEEPKWQRFTSHLESEGLDPSRGVLAGLWPDQHVEIGEYVAEDRRRFEFEIPFDEKEGHIERWRESPQDEERFPNGYAAYHLACWALDAGEGKSSDWIFTRPYEWKDRIKPGWNPPFGRPTLETPEDAALLGMNDEFVTVESVSSTSEDQVEVRLGVTDDPSGEFPLTIVCEQLPNGRWRQVES